MNNEDNNHVLKVFSRLMMRGNTRAAVRWITERGSNGILNPLDRISDDGEMTVLDALKEKHPEAGSIDDHEETLEFSDVPSFVDVDITGSHIERTARALHGGLQDQVAQLLFIGIHSY